MGGEGNGNTPPTKAEVDANPDFIMDEVFPLASQITFGAAMGLSSGYALRQVGRLAGLTLGAGFCLVQGLAYMGYVDVNWRKVERDYVKTIDRDGDGKITAKDFELIFRDVTDVLKFNMPAGSGFTGGLAYGLSGNLRIASALGGVYGVGGIVMRGAAATGLPAVAVAVRDEVEKNEGLNRYMPSWMRSSQKALTASGAADLARGRFVAELPTKSIEELREIEREIKMGRNESALLGDLRAVGEQQADARSMLGDQVEDAKKDFKERKRLEDSNKSWIPRPW